MLSKAQEKLIRSLHSKKGREKSGQCLVEGQKVIDVAGDAVQYVFHPNDSEDFEKLVTTETPQNVAAVATTPSWSLEDVSKLNTLVVLDGVQDPGNVGAILRLCLGFDAALVLVESVDVTNPKVIRSSVGAMFQVPWITASRADAPELIRDLKRPIFRLEHTNNPQEVRSLASPEQIVLIAGSEGSGIHLPIEGVSVSITHSEKLESLNVGNALAIALHNRK